MNDFDEEKYILELNLLLLLVEKANKICNIKNYTVNEIIEIGIRNIKIPKNIDINKIKISAKKHLHLFNR